MEKARQFVTVAIIANLTELHQQEKVQRKYSQKIVLLAMFITENCPFWETALEC